MAGGKFETTSLVVDGVLYATGADDRAFALDAPSGRPIWQYQRSLPPDIRPCCGRVNRGMAILGDKVFLGTLDAHVIALDTKTGNVVWDVGTSDYRKGYSITLAPLVINHLVLIGVSGGEYGIRGFIDAYDAVTGARKWRFYTVPGPGEPGHETWEGDSWKIGGAPAWITGTYDPATNTTFWTTGNPSPSNRGEGRAGDNLYSNSLLALDPDTGKLKWHFQFTKHDEHDYDATQGRIAHADGHTRVPGRAWSYQLVFAHVRSANKTFLRFSARAVRYLQHGAAALRSGPRFLRQRVLSQRRYPAVLGSRPRHRSRHEPNQVGAEASVALVVRGALDCGWTR